MSQIAEEANEVKSRFLVNMSYNIRIPLNNVLGFSQLMTTDPESMDADQWKEYSEIIQTNSAELIQLVNDVLNLSRLEAGRRNGRYRSTKSSPCARTFSVWYA